MSIVIETYVVCNSCDNAIIGHSTTVGTPQKTKARKVAEEHGWKCYIVGSHKIQDLCPKCRKGEQDDK